MTSSSNGAVSIGFAAASLARKIFGDLSGRTVVVVGAGEMGKLTARHMKSQGVHQVIIVSRTMAHAARTADAIGGATAAPSSASPSTPDEHAAFDEIAKPRAGDWPTYHGRLNGSTLAHASISIGNLSPHNAGLRASDAFLRR